MFTNSMAQWYNDWPNIIEMGLDRVWFSGSPVAIGYQKCTWATWNLYLVAHLGYQKSEHCYRLYVKVLQLCDAVEDNANRTNQVINTSFDEL